MKILKKIKNKFSVLSFYVVENFKHIIFRDTICIGGFSHSNNFGDALNVFFVQYLGEKKVLHSRYLLFKKPKKVVYVIGSILQWAKTNSSIWGSGFISEDEKLDAENLEIFAVRGELSKSKLKEIGYDTNRISMGDPALLMPYIYKPIIEKKYKVGIIPHYVDNNISWVKKQELYDGHFKVLDILCGSDVKGFIDEVLSCDVIISSSLHGLIIADAYNIPSVWVKFSDKLQGGNFKFNDYYSSIGYKNIMPIIINSYSSLNDIVSKCTLKKMDINLKNLVDLCPFITTSKKNEIINSILNVKKTNL